MASGSSYLLKERKFLPFFLTQFFGAFNDNAFKLSMLTLISYHLTQNQAQSEYYQAMAAALYILPFFLLSATAGQLADKYDKALLIRLIKILEVILMFIGSFALYWGNIVLMMITLTGLGTHSTFFGPIKYAILPDHLPKQDLLGATGLVEASTFLAILLGTTLGTLAIGTNSTPYLAVFMSIFVAIAGLVASLFIPSAPSSLVSLKLDFWVWRATFKMLKQAKEHSGIFLAILTISWFWLLGSVLLTKLPDYTHYVLGGTTTIFAVFLALFSVSTALGSLMVNVIFKGRVTLSIVPFAMFACSVFTFDLYWASPTGVVAEPLQKLQTFFTYFMHWRISFDLFMLSFSAGLFVVPLYTYLQVTSNPQSRARTIAVNNIYNALFMVLGSFMVIAFLHFSSAIPQIFLTLSMLNAIAALFVWLGLQKL